MSSSQKHEITVGTRGSLLAVSQTNWVIAQITKHHPDLVVHVQRITTTGDRDQTAPLPEVGQKGIFTKELEEALLNGSIDLAVHSAKDLPEVMPEHLAVLCTPPREDPRDALISRDGLRLDDLPEGAVLGTSSLRRQTQLRMIRADFQYCILRGNVDTRIKKVHRGDCDATLLAMAGLNRAGLTDQATCALPEDRMVPAPSQGVLAVQGRDTDGRVRDLLEPLEHGPTRFAFECEREIVRRLGGGCTTPIGLLVTPSDSAASALAVVAAPDGSRSAFARITDLPLDTDQVVERVFTDLDAQGAADIIEACREDT